MLNMMKCHTAAPLVIDPENKSQIQEDYDVGRPWPPRHGQCKDVRQLSTSQVYTVRGQAKAQIRDPDAARREIGILRALDHPNAIRLHAVYEDQRHLFLVVESCEVPRFRDVLSDRLDETQAAIVMSQLFSVVAHMHEHSICHRNLSVDTMMLKLRGAVGPETVVKVAGFELACNFEPEMPLTDIVGQVSYMAPEILDRNHSKFVDLWSCGVITFLLLCGYMPFRGSTADDVKRELYRGAFFFHPREWSDISEPAKNMIRGLLKTRPAQRLSAKEALQHIWLKKAARVPSSGELVKKEPEKPVPEVTEAPTPAPVPEAFNKVYEDGLVLDLELDSLPIVDIDVYSPIHCNPSLQPNLISRASNPPVSHPAKPGDHGALNFEPFGAVDIPL